MKPVALAEGEATVSWTPVYALCVTQVISWGTLYYAFSVLLDPIGRQFEWRQDQMVGAFSCSLLLTGASTFTTGLLLQKWSGRAMMSLGSALAALSLAAVSVSTSLPAFYLAWALAGIAMGATLYETAFSVLSGIYESNYKRAVTTVTLAGGFASTVFWPLTERLVAGMGWQRTLWCYVALQLAICLPLHLFAIPNHVRHSVALDRSALKRELGSLVRMAKFRLLATSYMLNAIVFSAISVHLVPMFLDRGMDAQRAAWLAAIAGPMQVLGRIVELHFGARWTASQTGKLAMAILVPALLIMYAGTAPALVVLCVALYGVSNGVMTIVKSVSIAETFGRERYSLVSGTLLAPSIISRAAGLFLASTVLVSVGNYQTVLLMLVLLSILALAAFWHGTR